MNKGLRQTGTSLRVSRRQVLAGIAGGVAFQSLSRTFRLNTRRLLTTINQSDIDKFRATIKGQVVLPNDPNFDQLRRVESFNPTSDLHPQMIVRCLDSEDVVRSLAFARDRSMDLAVRGGGHDLLGASVSDGMVIDLSRMKSINVDWQQRIAHVGAGVRSGELNAVTAQSGLAAVLGCSPGVGVAGLTLGGGLGWFLGKHGTAADNLLGAELITADGKSLKVTAKENSDLFWALKGGGGNFGIVTSLDFQLYPVNQVVGGVVAYRSDLGRFLRFYREFMQTAPDELAVELNIILTREPLIAALVCWSGNPAQGGRVLAALKSFGPPIADNVDLVPYSRVGERFAIIGQLLNQRQQTSEASVSPSPTPRPNTNQPYNYWRGGSLEELSDTAIDRLVACAHSARSFMSIGLGHYMHGQACRPATSKTPLARKAGQLTYFFSASWIVPGIAEVQMEWVNSSIAAMRPIASPRSYINYLSSDREQDVRASYGQSYERLARIKRQYDPTNLFHRNRNILPAG